MADKKKTAINLFPYFVDGEQPSANKFNSIGIQIARNLYVIEKSLGDIWAESEPYGSQVPTAKLSLGNSKQYFRASRSDETRTLSLNIPSIGRLLGPISKLNPLLLSEGLFSGSGAGVYSEAGEIVEEIHMDGYNSFKTRYNTNGGFVEITDENGNVFAFVDKAELGDPNDPNHPYAYSFGSYNNEILITPGTNGTLTVRYTHVPENTNGGPAYLGASANMIPDESQLENGIGLNITLVNGFYEVLLPTITHRNTSLENPNTTLLRDSDPMQGAQMKLPVVLREMFGGDAFKDPLIHTDQEYQPTSGSLIPEGFIYLKNVTTGELYTDAEYYYESDNAIKVGNVELDNLNDKFCLLTVGTDITSSIQDLNFKTNRHRHNGLNGEPRISHQDLVDNTRHQGNSGAFSYSIKEGNYLPQYLHRDGYDSTEYYINDNNAMRGDLVFAKERNSSGSSIADTAGGRVGGVGTSHGIYFGRFDTSGAYIKSKYIVNSAIQQLHIFNRRGSESNTAHNIWMSAEDNLILDGDDGFELKTAPSNTSASGLVQATGRLNLYSNQQIKIASPIIGIAGRDPDDFFGGNPSKVVQAYDGMSFGEGYGENTYLGMADGRGDDQVNPLQKDFRPSQHTSLKWFHPQVKVVTCYDPSCKFRAYSVGGVAQDNDGANADYVKGFISLPAELTHGDKDFAIMGFQPTYSSGFYKLLGPMKILPLQVSCFVRRPTGTWTVPPDGEPPSGSPNIGVGTYPEVLRGETYKTGDWHEVNQVTEIHGKENWKLENVDQILYQHPPSHLQGTFCRDGNGTVMYRILIDTDEGDDKHSPFDRKFLTVPGNGGQAYHTLEVVFTLTYLDMPRRPC